MIPVIVEQYIQKLNDPATPRNEKDNVRFVVQSIFLACEKALLKYDGKRG